MTPEERMASMEWSIDYHELSAIQKNWFPWWIGWRWPLVGIGNDEYFRRTLIVGPICFPLWRCRCEECQQIVNCQRARVDAGAMAE